MRTYLALALLVPVALALAACSAPEVASAPQAATTFPGGFPAAGMPAPGNQGTPISLQLLIGTFKLEGTDLAVTAEQAAGLLPLWQAVNSLSGASTAAPQELNAVLEQIAEAMTPEQMAAITGMNLTRADLAEFAQERGIEFGAAGGERPALQITPGAGGGQGGFAGPGGGFFGGGPGGPGGLGQLSPEQQATLEARRAANGNRANFGASPALVAELIELLQSRATSQ